MKKDTALKYLTTAATIEEMGLKLDKEAGGIFCELGRTNEIHLTEKGFRDISEALQPTITFDPNWSSSFPDTLEGHFTVEIFEKKWYVFALMKKGGTK